MEKRKTIIAAVILLLVFIVGGAIAYFTDKYEVTNTFTIGDVEIEVLEPAWVSTGSAEAVHMMPGETAQKDPQIHNKSETNPAYVFMKIDGPCSTGENDTEVRELFPYTADTTHWYLLTENPVCDNGNIERLYAYGTSSAMATLAVDATTEALFTYVTLNTAVDGSETGLDDVAMLITGYAIQKEGVTQTDPAEIWDIYFDDNNS